MARSVFYFTDARELGGAEQALLILIESLDRVAWQPTLFYHDAPAVARLAKRARELGAKVRPVPPMPLGLQGARRVPWLMRELRRSRPNVFHAHLSWPLAAKYGLAAAVLARVPAIIATVQLFPDFRLDRSNYLQERLLEKGVDRYIAVSQDIAYRLTKAFRWPPAKIEVIHNSVQPERFRCSASPDLRRELTGGIDQPLVLTAARLDVQKGLETLLEAGARVPEACFVLAGDGPERVSLESKAAALGLGDRVRFIGYSSNIPQLLAASDVFVLPSLYEGSSLALLEAMAAGKPVISSAIGGTDELIVNGSSGVLVAPGDADALAVALRRLLADPASRARIGAAARDRSERLFSASSAATRVARLYEEVLERKSSRRGA